MKLKNKEPELFEYKFHYHLEDDTGAGDKYFLAHDREEAAEMFCYACNKKRLELHDVNVSKWNRWKGEWEIVKNSSNCGDVSRN